MVDDESSSGFFYSTADGGESFWEPTSCDAQEGSRCLASDSASRSAKWMFPGTPSRLYDVYAHIPAAPDPNVDYCDTVTYTVHAMTETRTALVNQTAYMRAGEVGMSPSHWAYIGTYQFGASGFVALEPLQGLGSGSNLVLNGGFEDGCNVWGDAKGIYGEDLCTTTCTNEGGPCASGGVLNMWWRALSDSYVKQNLGPVTGDYTVRAAYTRLTSPDDLVSLKLGNEIIEWTPPADPQYESRYKRARFSIATGENDLWLELRSGFEGFLWEGNPGYMDLYGQFDNIIVEPASRLTCITLADAVRFVPSAFCDYGTFVRALAGELTPGCFVQYRLPVIFRNASQ